MYPDSMKDSPLFLSGWVEFNHLKWKLKPRLVQFTNDAGLPRIKTVFNMDQRGHLRLPHLNIYLPIHFEATPTQEASRLNGSETFIQSY